MARGLESSVALCEDILQKIQKSDEEREQLAKELQSKAEEVTNLNEQLKLYKQAGEYSCVILYHATYSIYYVCVSECV